MKKLLSIISLLLVAMMIVVPVSAEESEEWKIPEGIKIYYAENVTGKTPVIDGTIAEGEYGQAYRCSEPIPVDSSLYRQEEPVYDPTAVSEYIDVWFAYDEENIYVAVYDMGPEAIEGNEKLVAGRNNYLFQFGFDLTDMTSYLQFGGFATQKQWASDQFCYFEFGNRNPSPGVKLYDMVTECVVKKVDVLTGEVVAFGDLLSANGNANYNGGQWALSAEFKFNREAVADVMNSCYFTDYDTTSNAMYFALLTMAYGRNEADPSQYYRWFAQTDIAGKQGNYSSYGLHDGMKRDTIFDLIVFGDENTVIELAEPFPVRETEAPTTEAPVTEAPATEVPTTEAPVTEAPTTEPTVEEGGCGASVALAGIALVATLGTCTAFVAKKKED